MQQATVPFGLSIAQGALESPLLLWSVFGLVVAAYLAVSWVLFYHWRTFGRGAKAVVTAESAYIVGSMGLLAAALVSLIAI